MARYFDAMQQAPIFDKIVMNDPGLKGEFGWLGASLRTDAWFPSFGQLPLVLSWLLFYLSFSDPLPERVIHGRTLPQEYDILSVISRPTGVLLVLAIFVLLVWWIDRYRTDEVSDWTATLFPDHGVPNFRSRRQSKLNLPRK